MTDGVINTNTEPAVINGDAIASKEGSVSKDKETTDGLRSSKKVPAEPPDVETKKVKEENTPSLPYTKVITTKALDFATPGYVAKAPHKEAPEKYVVIPEKPGADVNNGAGDAHIKTVLPLDVEKVATEVDSVVAHEH